MTLDATDRALDEEIAAARDKLIAVAAEEGDAWWTAYDLKVRARNGWSSGAISLALRQLIADGTFEQRKTDLRIRLRSH